MGLHRDMKYQSPESFPSLTADQFLLLIQFDSYDAINEKRSFDIYESGLVLFFD